MVKILGATMILLSGIGLALFLSINSRMRISNLTEMLRILNLMSGKIRFDEASLPDIAMNFSRQTGAYSEFFLNLAYKMRSTDRLPFDMIWKCSVDEYLMDTSLTKEDKQELKSFGINLGNTDKQLQLGIISDYATSLKKKIDELRGQIQTKTKLYMSFGILGSLFIIILLY